MAKGIRWSAALLAAHVANSAKPAAQPKPAKYRNVKVKADGVTFDSKAECARWQQLCLEQQAGEISGLLRQVGFVLIPSTILAGRKMQNIRYVADFVYVRGGAQVVEDKKGVKTREYMLKRRLMKHIHNIEVLET